MIADSNIVTEIRGPIIRFDYCHSVSDCKNYCSFFQCTNNCYCSNHDYSLVEQESLAFIILCGSMDLMDSSNWDEPVMSSTKPLTSSVCCWNHSQASLVKILVDGVAFKDIVDCGGALRDDTRLFSILFSGPISLSESDFYDAMSWLLFAAMYCIG
ncbi:hypothetical protein GQ457_09G019570 [Hibiscus cannabinus]